MHDVTSLPTPYAAARIATFLAEHLLAEGDRVLGCSRRGDWPAFVPAHVRGAASLVAWDVTQPATGTPSSRA